MCGRIACLLDPQTICHACSPQKPQWTDSQSGKYYPGANKMPTSYCPIMYRTAEGELVVQPMMWGLIPRWHKGKPTSHGLSSNNARIETIEASKLYSRLVPRSRCVVLAQGFYEWRTIGAKKGAPKEPFFIFPPAEVKQEQDTKGGEKKAAAESQTKTLRELWTDPSNYNGETWSGPPLLKMAGLYDVWKGGEDEVPVYSFTVITMESNETISWLHDRMPAILETQEQCEAWLNGADLKTTLKQANKLKYYAVDPKVNNSRCHDEDCMDPKEAVKQSMKGEASFMAKWLKRPAESAAPAPAKGKDGEVEVKKEEKEDDEDVKPPKAKAKSKGKK